MQQLGKLLFVLIALSLLLPLANQPVQAQTAATHPQAAQQDAMEPLYVALIWHQHQPVYFKDPETGVYVRPWVRVHATKDYVDMVTILEDYPEVQVTFNLTPSLIRQLDDLAAGTKDLYWVLSEVPAEELTDEQKGFILRRFFDINPRIIARFPRYQELADMRGGASDEQIAAAVENWHAQDFRDLQVLFNLGWTDPTWLAQEPLAALVEKERDFVEEDKDIIFAEHLRLIQEVIPVHASYQEAGQIEVTMTPFAHPILPLLIDSNVAAVGMPEANLPERFIYGQDAVAQVNLGVEFYEEHFGMAPRGMWPAEGSVSDSIIQMTANAGIEWIATDEDVLARSLPDIEDFTRDSADTVQQADQLYRPYTVTGGRGGEVAIIFRDHLISDRIGFEYSGTPGEEAAADLMERLNNIQAQLAEEGAEGPHLVTILLDGENAWEHYENDGKEFLHAMYRNFSEADNIVTVTPSEYLAMLDEEPRPLESLFPGSWITPDFATWIGEEEENLAWEYLRRMREDVQDALPDLDEATQAEVMELVYIAEGSDWFWWYGSDQNSGNDEDFDAQFRGYLEQIYTLLGEEVPNFVYVPIIPEPNQPPTREAGELVAVEVDGAVAEGEWEDATYYDLSATTEDFSGLYYGFDDENLYLRLDAMADYAEAGDTAFEFYLRVPDEGPANAYTQTGETLVGFGAERLISVSFEDGMGIATLAMPDGDGGWAATDTPLENVAVGANTLEVQAPLAAVSPAARGGDRLNLRLAVAAGEMIETLIPTEGPALAVVPDQGVPNPVLTVPDPAEDDYGPGTYTYPTDGVFRPGAYDATEFIVGADEEEVVFQLALRGPLVNDWDAPNGMGILTVDIYIDVDGPANGARLLLPGRNAALSSDYAWDYAIFAEGWEAAIYVPGEEGPTVASSSALNIVSNPGQRRVTIRVPRSVIPGDPAEWNYLATVASQEGFPASGVLRIRDVQEAAEQWRLGGSPGHSNATRLIDVVLPESAPASQAELLSNYPPSEADVDDLSPDDFAQLPMIGVQE